MRLEDTDHVHVPATADWSKAKEGKGRELPVSDAARAHPVPDASSCLFSAQPNAPKKNQSAYMIFCNEQRVSKTEPPVRERERARLALCGFLTRYGLCFSSPARSVLSLSSLPRFTSPLFLNPQPIVKEENPDATFGEMGKLLGAKWKGLDDTAKKVGLCSVLGDFPIK